MNKTGLTLIAAFNPPSGHLRALTGLRGAAALWVLLYHMWQFADSPKIAIGWLDFTPIFACGFFGVDLFFVLSGFLLAQPYIRARMAGAPQPSLKRFWIRRIRRVIPAYWAQITVLLIIAAAGGGGLALSGLDVAGHFGMFFNLYRNDSTLNAVYWSLPIEWNFYMLLPLLALGLARGSSRPWGLLAGAVVFALAFRLACAYAISAHGADGIEFYRWIIQAPARIDQFVFGMAAAWLFMRGAKPRTAFLLGLVGVIVVLNQTWWSAPRGDFFAGVDLAWTWWHFTALGLGFACVTAAMALVPCGRLARAFSGPFMGFLGVISYSLYLWHYPVLIWLQPLAGQDLWNLILIWWMAAPALALLLASVSYLLVERPFLGPTAAKPVIAPEALKRLP